MEVKNITFYKILAWPVALYACGAWATTKSNELKLTIFKCKILKRIYYGPKINDEGEYEIRTNQKILNLYGEATINGTHFKK